jgi:hypoxanthine phosphoribosyltransferase
VGHTVLFSAETIHEAVGRLAAQIDASDVDALVVVPVLKGAAIFSSDLIRGMETETELIYITASSYVKDFTPSDTLTVNQETELGVRDRHLLIVEDIIDTERIKEAIAATVAKEAPKSVSTVALINKTNRRNTDFEATYTGFDITDEFIYGYGLDWNQQYRDLPYIAIATRNQRITAPPGQVAMWLRLPVRKKQLGSCASEQVAWILRSSVDGDSNDWHEGFPKEAQPVTAPPPESSG